MRALLRRHRSGSEVVRLAGFGEFDTSARQFRPLDGPAVGLSERESDLLALLARHPEQVFERETLLHRVFPDAEDVGVVDTYVHYLRRKLGRSVVSTVRGIGYRLGSP